MPTAFEHVRPGDWHLRFTLSGFAADQRISKNRDILNSTLGIYNPLEFGIGGLAALMPTIDINTQRKTTTRSASGSRPVGSVDSRGIASTGTVVRIDLDRRVVTYSIDVGLHPTAIAWDEPRQRLYVANANNDSLSIVDIASPRVVATMPMQPFGVTLKGVAPSAIAVAADGRRVYVALGGLNAVAVVDSEQQIVRGYIPTAWYPNHVAMSANGLKLAVATLLGVGSGWQDAPAPRYVHAYRGTVSVLPVPDDQQLASYTSAVAEDNQVTIASEQLAPSSAGTAPTALPVPLRAGDPSPIEHVVYIIKENRPTTRCSATCGAATAIRRW